MSIKTGFRRFYMRKVIVIIIIFIFCFNLFAEGKVDTQEIGTLNLERKILIATESTNFKDSLLRVLLEKINDGNTYINVISHMHGELVDIDPRDYGAVLIINSGQRAIVRPWISEWLNSVSAYDDNIILLTTHVTEWTPDVNVDSITSVSISQPEVYEEFADKLVNKINALLR